MGFMVAVLLVLGAAPPVVLAMDLVRDGNPVARVYISGALLDDQALSDKSQARNWRSSSPMIRPRSAIRDPAVVIGALAVRLGVNADNTTESGEGFRLIARDQRLLIGGQTDAAAALGVYELLERLGCDWVMPGKIGEIIPKRATVSLADPDVSEAPSFLTRKPWYRGYDVPKLRLPEEAQRFRQWLRR
jgi:hypothetical protein